MQSGGLLPCSFNSLLRVFSSFFILLLAVTYYLLLFNSPGLAFRIVLGVSEGLAFAVLFSSALACVLTRTADPLIDPERTSIEGLNKRSIKFCEACRSIVQKSSKHCYQCGQCKEQFDHHCPWINCCITAHNYLSFAVMIVALLVFLALYAAVAIVNFTQEQRTRGQARWGSVAGVVLGGIGLVFACLDLYLIGLHIYLRKNDQTTYGWLKQKPKEGEPREERGIESKQNLGENLTI